MIEAKDRIVSYQVSFVDHPQNVTLTVFLAGCNMSCDYCFNREIINYNTIGKENFINYKEVENKIKRSIDMLDSVTVSGGEPLLYNVSSLIDMMEEIKDFGLKINLFTNGTLPLKLERVIPHIDRVAMDIKKPVSEYHRRNKVLKSIELIEASDINHEFRTVALPELTVEDIDKITDYISGEYAIRPYEKKGRKWVYEQEFIEKIEEICEDKFEEFKIEL